MNKIIFSISLILLLVIPANALALGDLIQVFVTSDSTVNQIGLKATQNTDGDIDTAENFVITPGSVIQVQQGKVLNIVINEQKATVEKVKVTDIASIVTELTPVSINSFTTNNLPSGTYLLNIIINVDGVKYAYETVLVLLAPGQALLPPTSVIQSTVIKVKTDVKVIFKDHKPKDDLRKICAFDPEDERCNPDEDGNCPKGFGTNEGGQCFPLGNCPKGYHRANDDESGRCVFEKDLQKCEDGSFAHKNDICPEDEEPTCDPGYVDNGNGCEPEIIDQCPPGSPPIDWCTINEEEGNEEEDTESEPENELSQPPVDEDESNQPPVDEEEQNGEEPELSNDVEEPEEEEESSDSGGDTGGDSGN
jgi:hypothetical protein